MIPNAFDNPAFAFAMALAAGVLAQSLARRLRVPGIVVLLLTGVLLGPQVLGLIRPASFGRRISEIVGLSVAVILFEGSLGLNLARLRREALVIRRLILVGSLVSAVGATLVVRAALGWPWAICALFGTLVMVTGPTVITPLLRRIRVTQSVETILEAEGVLIDPIGAIVAVVALEIVLAETTGDAAFGLIGLPARLGLGAGIGALGGLTIARILRSGRLIPQGLENVFTLSMVLAIYEISNAVVRESGILAVTAAGLIVGNLNSRISRELREFKEQLTILLVGMLFVLLAADVRLARVASLGWGGVAAVALLMFVVRPVNVLASTVGSGLNWHERAFIAWLSPRGIVAAAVASVFARRLTEAGLPLGPELRALVFLVIIITVVVQGLSGVWVAERLGVRRRSEHGYVIVGAGLLGRALARILGGAGEEIVLIDSNPAEVRAAQTEGLRVIYGNANDEDVLERADVEGRRGFLAVTPNAAANLLLAQRARRQFHLHHAYSAVYRGKPAVDERRAADVGVKLLFGREANGDEWLRLLGGAGAEVQIWEYAANLAERPLSDVIGSSDSVGALLPLAVLRGSAATPVDEDTVVRGGDRVALLVRTEGEGVPPAHDNPPAWRRVDEDGGAWSTASHPRRLVERDAANA